ncbi:MAG TPA: hypothetical protein VKY57_13105 [Chitinispirillaceae bacterium]|nr:hypothetical protein [Fibrobacter sp.]HLV32500.1 hypothetical protein [Chitinispirillaceae bacterium]
MQVWDNDKDYDNDFSFFSSFFIHNSPFYYDLHSHKTLSAQYRYAAHSRTAGQAVN